MIQLKDRYKLQKITTNYPNKGDYHYRITDIKQNTYTTCSESLVRPLLKLIKDVHDNKSYEPNHTGHLYLKLYDLYNFRPYIKDCESLIKKVEPKSKYMGTRYYNCIVKDRAWIVALNLAIKEELKAPIRIREKPLEVFKTNYIKLNKEEEKILQVYKEVYNYRDI